MSPSSSSWLSWAFSPSPHHPKHRTYSHSIFASCTAILSTIFLSIHLADFFDSYFPPSQYQENYLPAWGTSIVVPCLISYLILMVITRLSQNGSTSLYEIIWTCNQAIIMMICGILRGSAVTVGASVVIISIDQCLWYIDIIGFILIRKFPVGVAQYITWPSTTKLRLFTSTHHLWFIPLLLALLKHTQELTHAAFFFSFIMTLFQSILGRIFAPKYIKAIDEKSQDIYMNINLAHELWKDVKIKFLTRYDHAPAYKTVPFSNLVWNIGNYVFFIVLRCILNWIKD